MSLNVKEMSLTFDKHFNCLSISFIREEVSPVKETWGTKNALFFMFFWTYVPEHGLYCMYVSAYSPCGSRNFVLSHSFTPKSPIKTMPVFVFGLVLLYLYCCVLLVLCVGVFCVLHLHHTHILARWNFTKSSAMLWLQISINANKILGCYFASLRWTRVLLLCALIKVSP